MSGFVRIAEQFAPAFLQICAQTGKCSAEVCIGVVPELENLRVALERGLHDPALNAAAATVDEPDLANTGGCGGVDILGDDRADVARREGVEIQFVFDRNPNGLVGHNQLSALSPEL
jgi:hypothetical protein